MDVNELKEYLEYQPNTGKFFWITDRTNVTAGEEAGCDKVYRVICINNRRYYAQVLAWLYMTGEWPEEMVDHKDGNKLNNCWNNLRAATRSENNANAQLRKDSTSGVKGVTWASNIGKWRARIQHNGRRITIGYFDSPEIAVAEIKQKRSELHKEFANHG